MRKVGSASMTVRRQTTIDRSPIESLLYWGLIPAWGVPGLVDWWYHRRSQIERPDHGGVRESLIHSLMLAENGLAVGLALLADVNPAALAVMTAAAVVHEATAHRDVALANGSARRVAAGEQQTHSFLETLPFVLVGLLAASHWPRLRSTWRQPSSWRLQEARRFAACPLSAGRGRRPDRDRRHPLHRGAGPLRPPPRPESVPTLPARRRLERIRRLTTSRGGASGPSSAGISQP